MTPRATVRLQLHAGFTLHDARERVPYYAALGISHFYLSPVTRAVTGSTHGYDVVDHACVSPELGGEAALRALAEALHARGMGIVADIVPNHMAAHPDNAWWADVLRHGRESRWASHFDIQWRGPEPGLRGRLLLPVLPAPYEDCLRRGEITLDHAGGAWFLRIGGMRYPLAEGSIDAGLAPRDALAASRDPARGPRLLHRILERQHYRLAWWRTAPDCINWRRFFEISTLVGVRVERPEVFEDVHALPLRLYAQGVLDGLRVDHVDGLAAPGAYLRRLRERLAEAQAVRAGGPAYLVVEKILAPGESLDARWPVDGTTGYDFLDEVAGLLHDPQSERPLREHWVSLCGDTRPPAALLAEARRRMLDRHFGAERRALVGALERMLRLAGESRDWSTAAVDRAVREWLTAFPVYRTYAEDGGPGAEDLARVNTALAAAGRADAELLTRLMHLLYGPAPASGDRRARAALAARERALCRLQQLTPPLAAKALEDTLFYRYGPLLSRNEVGASPGRYALSLEDFHESGARRARDLPRAMLATATHDHKRGEDARARLAVLSEIPRRWGRISAQWLRRWPQDQGQARADRYMLLQTLVGAWPPDLPPSVADTPDDALRGWLERVAQWQEKALREAKLRTSWTEPDPAVEQAARDAVFALTQDADGRELLRGIAAFAHALAPAGMINSLSQVLLRNAAPGVPDLYQGADLWDFSLVDPDNRRPVDHALRERMLGEAQACRPGDPSHWRDGRIKQALLAALLRTRQSHAACFESGAYFPLRASGPRAQHVVAFIRQSGDQTVLAVAPRLCAARLAGHAQGQATRARRFWGSTRLHLPACAWPVPRVRNLLDGSTIRLDAERCLDLRRLLADWPVALAVQAPAA